MWSRHLRLDVESDLYHMFVSLRVSYVLRGLRDGNMTEADVTCHTQNKGHPNMALV